MASAYIQHRAASVMDSIGFHIGADRLLLSVTHTHSGPANFVGMHGYDQYGSSIAGYDPVLADSLSRRIARAVVAAAGRMDTARAAWGVDSVWGYTRIRDITAFRRNPDPVLGPDSLPERQRAVDPRWAMLRVDVRRGGRWVPRGAFSLFAVHATAISEENELYDGDVQGTISSLVESGIDGTAPDGDPAAVHLMANSAEGDVSPATDTTVRCRIASLTRERRATGPRTPTAPEAWVELTPGERRRCLDARKAWTDSVGHALAARALALFRRIGQRMDADPRRAAERVELARAFESIPLANVDSLADRPVIGLATPAGAEDGYTRYRGSRLFGFGHPEGEPLDSADRSRRARRQDPKDRLFSGLIRIVGGPHAMPLTGQFAVVRVGGVVLAALPFEATTTTGRAVRAAMQPALAPQRIAPDSTFVLGLTNGYISYAPTAPEYTLQLYEGSSALYGRGTAHFLAYEARRLAERLPAPGAPSPTVAAWQDSVFPWSVKEYMPRAPKSVPEPRITSHFPEGDTALVVRWTGAAPGLFPGDSAEVRAERQTEAGWVTVTTDRDRELEVRLVRARGDAAEWEARWAPCARAAGVYRLVLLPRAGAAGATSDPFPAVPERTCRRRAA
jgi:neutral ceramidase